MKKLLLSLSLLLLVIVGYSQTSMTITNNTGVDLYGVYVAEVGSEEISDDLLPVDIFANGTQVEITFPEGYSCSVNIAASYINENGEEEVGLTFTEVDICTVSNITVNDDGTFEIN